GGRPGRLPYRPALVLLPCGPARHASRHGDAGVLRRRAHLRSPGGVRRQDRQIVDRAQATPAARARASTCLARSRWGWSNITPSMAITPAAGLAANASTTAVALAIAFGVGVNTSLIAATWPGWIAILAVKPSRRASSASRRS